MKVINQAFVFVLVMLNSFAFCAVSQGEEYKATDLPFKAADLVIEKGGGYSETVVKDGEELKLKPMCSGISLNALFLGDREIPLQSTKVTSDAMIVTKDYGNLRIKINMATFSYSILVTPKQEELLRKLTAKGESASVAQPANVAEASEAETTDVNALNLPAFPFLAEITSDDVYIRSGPGTQYYNSGKARKGDKVKVVSNKFSWLQIVPPAGSYSWISKQYVQIDPQNNTSGTVIGEAVRVYAGSDEVQPMHSASMQVKLNKGDKITIVGEEKDGLCKIAPLRERICGLEVSMLSRSKR
jgi:SH3-like domain-containing protein